MRTHKKSILRIGAATLLAIAALTTVSLSSKSFADLVSLVIPTDKVPVETVTPSADAIQEGSAMPPCTDGWDSRFGTPTANGAVWAVVQDASGNIYVGGDFTSIGGITANGVATWNGFTWSALGSGVNGIVTSIAVSGTDVFVAGDFTTAGGSTANRVARWNGSSWSALGTGLDDTVWTLAVSGTDLYAGGEFLNAGGSAANRVARWNGAAWSSMGTGANGPVWALRSALNGIVAGGSFTSAGGVGSTGGIARWNGSAWSALGSGFGTGEVHALVEDQGILYAGGRLSASGATVLSNIASWNGTAWSPVGTGVPSPVLALAASGGRVYASRDVREAIGTASAPALRWNGTAWSELGTGTDSPINSLLVSGGSVYTGGFFSVAGCRTSSSFARFFENSYSGSAGGDWHTSGNWSNGVIPNNVSSAVIKDADVSITSADAAVLDLQVEEGRTITIAAGRTLIVSGALILNGTISGAGTVEVASCNANAVVRDAAGSGKITAAFKRCVAPGGDFVFPTGGSSGYSPVRLSNVVGQSTFTVKVTEQAYSAAADLPTNRLGRYWDLTNDGITSANVTFFYNASDITSGTEANYKVFRIAGTSAVNVGGTINTTARSATVTGVTSFSPWTLAEPSSNCSYSITPSSTQSIGIAGGTVNVSVTATTGCAWSAVSNNPWITVTSGASGSGNGSVVLTVAANTGGARTGTVNIGGQILTIEQAEACSISISPLTATYAAAGGTGTVTVTAGTGCAWTAVSGSSWITVTGGASGTGNGSVSLSVGANSGQERTGSVTIGGQTHSITQSAAAVSGSVAGTVRYYGGTQPLVAGVTLTAAGTPQVSVTTASNGTYTLSGLGSGAYTVTPAKTGEVGGIASADAARVAQAVVGLVTLTANQQIAADATANGTVSSADAARIAQYIVGLNPTGATGTWKFAPTSKTYASVTTNVTGEDYAAIMVGDVTGNWTAPVAASEDSQPVLDSGLPGLFGAELFTWRFGYGSEQMGTVTPVDVVLGDVPQARVGETVTVPVRVGDLSSGNVTSFDFEIAYDASVLRPVFGRAAQGLGTMSSNFVITPNPAVPGTLKVSGFGIAPLSGSGELLNLSFEVVGTGRAAALEWKSFIFNEGEVPAKVRSRNGELRQGR